MKRTTKYQLGYFEEGDRTSGITEMQRWETLDAQLYGLFSVLGNGIISGWALVPSSGLSIAVSPGQGHVNFVAVNTTGNTILSQLTPNTTNYIYATLTTSSYWDQTVNFVAYVTTITSDADLYLGYAVTNSTSVTSVNMDNINNLGFINLVQQLVKSHRHIGGANNPDPINLATDVQGVINQSNLPDLDASVIKTGVINQSNLPLIDHITHLINQGTLTHSQLDSYVRGLDISGSSLMGETSSINLLQLILALKHVYPDIDQYLVNEIAYVPGISPDSYVDWDNTTADVDVAPSSQGGQHTITGLPSPGKQAYTYTWNSEAELSSGEKENVTIDGDYATLDTQEQTLVIDEFADLSKWQVITNDLSSLSITLQSDTSTYVEPPSSAKLVIGDQTVEIALIIKKVFNAMDWSQYSKFVFFLKTDSVQHGDIYFYLNDNFAGTQNSHTKVLNRNEPTVNIDTLQNGWQQITIDISSYTRTNINSIGFNISSQSGWDTSKPFDMNLDNIYLTTGYTYQSNGYLRVTFGGEFLYDFWRLRWDALIPSDADSSGIVLKARTRVGNSVLDLQQSMWSSYFTVSGSDIALPTENLYQYIEIEMYFGASTDLSRTAALRSIYLDFYASDVDNSFNYDTKGDWDSGTNINIDTNTVSNAMTLNGIDEIDDIIYGSEGIVSWRNSGFSELYRITGSMLPRSTYQILNSLPPALGLITGVSRGNNGSLWISDTDNDRVLELDKSGGLIRGFFGSYLVENKPKEATTTTTSTTTSVITNISLLQALYNSNKGLLYLIFNRDLTSTEVSGITNNLIKIGTNSFFIDGITLTNTLAGFEHVYSLQLVGANKTALNYMVNALAPSILVLSPYQQQRLGSSAVDVKFLLYNFDVGVGAGAIRVTLDNAVVEDIYSTSISYTLASGVHTIKAQLVNADSSLNTNIEAIAESSFVIYVGSYNKPYVSITSPKPNQIYSSAPVQIDFSVENFPILATGLHVRYELDTDAPVDYYSTTPIILDGVLAGSHSLRIYLVSSNGTELTGVDYIYGSCDVNFIVGLNSLAIPKFYCSYNGSIINSTIDVVNLIFSDIYAPFDIQYIPGESSPSNPEGKESILIGKLTNDYVTGKLGV